MMDVITGKTRPDEGDVFFEGDIDLTKLDEASIANLGIGRKFQKPTVFDNHSVIDNLMLAIPARRTPWLALIRPATIDIARITEILDTVAPAVNRKDHHLAGSTLSHGQKQWLEIGMLLCQDPKLLLGGRAGRRHDRRRDRTDREPPSPHRRGPLVVVVEHDMAFVRELDVRVTVLHEGSVLSEGSLDQVSADERVIDVYLGR